MSTRTIGSLLGLTLLLTPLISQATDDSRITSISMTSQSDTSLTTLTTYELTLVTSSTIAANEKINFIVQGAEGIDQTFDFAYATFTSSTIVGTSSLPYSFVYTITLSSDLAAGTHLITLIDVTNGDSEGGSHYWGANTVDSIGPGTDTTLDLTSFYLGEISEPTFLVFGTNIEVSWEAHDEASSYGVIISENEITSEDVVIETGDQQGYLFNNLSGETTYYFYVIGYYSNGVQFSTPIFSGSTTTEKSIESTKYSKPTVPKKKINKTTATVKWTIGDDANYIESFSLKLKLKDKTVKTYKNISASAVSKKLEELKPGKTYTVQLRAKYTTDEATKWSKAVEFKTDSE